jgi:hypothetical protein
MKKVIFVFFTNLLAQFANAQDATNAAMATADEINKFKSIKANQMGVGILGGGSTMPYYFNHNEPNERTYKYKKKTAFGTLDSWYPVSPDKVTVCGTLADYSETSDLKHTWVTRDRDFNFIIKPSSPFSFALSNRWTEKKFTEIEGEVCVKDLDRAVLDLNRRYQDKFSTTNTIFDDGIGPIKQKVNQNVCVHGPQMLDKLGSTPFLKNRENNEIHPINQFWFIDNTNSLSLTAVVDGSGYFDKAGSEQMPASGKDLPMSFYVAFNFNDANTLKRIVVSGSAYDTPTLGLVGTDMQPVSLTWNGKKVLEVEKQFLDNKKSYVVSIEGVRKLPSGKIIGYVVIQVLPISQSRGSVTLKVKTMSGILTEKTPECAAVDAVSADIVKSEDYLKDVKANVEKKAKVIPPSYGPGGILKPREIHIPQPTPAETARIKQIQDKLKELRDKRDALSLSCIN